MSALEFILMVAFDDWCGTRWPRPFPPKGGLDTLINNIYGLTLAGLLVTIAVTHPEQALSLQYGPLMIVPAINIVSRLSQNNASVQAETKVKM